MFLYLGFIFCLLFSAYVYVTSLTFCPIVLLSTFWKSNLTTNCTAECCSQVLIQGSFSFSFIIKTSSTNITHHPNSLSGVWIQLLLIDNLTDKFVIWSDQESKICIVKLLKIKCCCQQKEGFCWNKSNFGLVSDWVFAWIVIQQGHHMKSIPFLFKWWLNLF